MHVFYVFMFLCSWHVDIFQEIKSLSILSSKTLKTLFFRKENTYTPYSNGLSLEKCFKKHSDKNLDLTFRMFLFYLKLSFYLIKVH